jgi:hypothetical protein
MRPRAPVVVLALFSTLIAISVRPAAQQAERLSDEEFAGLVRSASEKDGTFFTDNFVSNERRYLSVLNPLTARVKPGGVYIGVGPEQNFTFINALQPSLSFIVDVRRQNLVEHLLYKMAFEASPTRADFLSYLFSRPRPPNLGTSTNVTALFRAYLNVPRAVSLLNQHQKAAIDELRARFGPMFTKSDEGALKYVFQAFFDSGPLLTYVGDIRAPKVGTGVVDRFWPTLATVMTATDDDGQQRSYLATETDYLYVKALEERNLIVPVVGNFGGPKALRAVGEYIASRGQTVSAFYLSNVEQYLFQGGPWKKFYENVAALPLDDSSTFIRFWAPVLDPNSSERLSPIKPFLAAVAAGQVKRYEDLGKWSK